MSDKQNSKYNGFILDRSKTGIETLCAVTFYPSSEDGLYIPRLTFRKVDSKGGARSAQGKDVIVEIKTSTAVKRFWLMVGFLNGYKDFIDTGEFDSSYSVISADKVIGNLAKFEKVERLQEILQYIHKSDVNLSELNKSLLKSEREAALDLFEDFLNGRGFNQYREEKSIKESGDEVIWKHFFKDNKWILGLNLQLQFIDNFLSEVSTGVSNTSRKGGAFVDQLGYNDYTILVENKTSETKIFTEKKSGKARANTWSFSSDFIEAVSQSLAQRSDFDQHAKTDKLLDEKDKLINREIIRTVDPKIILIIGNREKEFPVSESNLDNIIKRDTFRRYRENSPNVTIITFDELFERAKSIVYEK